MANYFKRYEKKYMIDFAQYQIFMQLIGDMMIEDKRSGYMISNLYYDTDNYDLIRASIEKPVYKEKLRLRTYGAPGVSTPSYIELKKKVDGIVYKRRFESKMMEAIAFLGGGLCPVVDPVEEYTVKEIQHFLGKNDVSPKALITYDRTAFHSPENKDFRMTFDSGILYKDMSDNAFLQTPEMPVLEPDKMIMEIKTPSSIPIWLSKLMSDLKIFPTPFSKYGMAYKTYVANQMFMTRNDMYNLGNKKEVELSA